MPAFIPRRVKFLVMRFAKLTLSVAPGLSVLAIAAAVYAISAHGGRW